MVVRRYSSAHRDGARLQEPRVVENLLSRYRNLILLAMVVVGQLLLLAWQVRTAQDVRLIRVWAVTAVTPMAGVVEAIRHNTIGFLNDYFILLDVREQNRKLQNENSRLKLDNIYFRNQLQTADRARILAAFQNQTPSRTVATRLIGNGTASSAQVVFVDRGSTSGIEKGMAVVTPDGIVGKVFAVYPLASQVLLVTDPTFAVGVESQKGHVHGTLHCNGLNCTVEYVQNEEDVQKGEWFYTSGEDRIFPKGFPVGTVSAEKTGQFMKEIHLALSSSPGSVDEVLVVLQGVHQPIPATPPQVQLAKDLPRPAEENTGAAQAPRLATEADQIKQKYLELGKEQKHEYGAMGSNMPDFTQHATGAAAPAAPPSAAGAKPNTAAATTPSTAAATAPSKKLPAAVPAPYIPPEVLGERPQAKQPEKPVAPATPRPTPGPSLPLGSPRRTPAPSPGTDAPQP
jgi:rod shape-determining protein MreC